MTGRAARIVSVTCLLATVGTTGCGAELDTMVLDHPAESTRVADPLTRTEIAGFVETGTAAVSSRELTLPAGCYVSDHTAGLAAYSQATGVEYPRDTLGLLDLATGRYRTVLPRPVDADRRFDVFTPRLSDEWLAWEEVSPGEGHDPANAVWRLYAARIDPETLAIDEPALIDQGRTAVAPRPFYGVNGGVLVWTAGATDAAPRAPAGRALMEIDPATGETREVYRAPAPIERLRVRDGLAVLGHRGTESEAETVEVVSIESGEVVDSARPSGGPLSHFPDYSERVLVWTAFEHATAPWPDLYLREARGGDVLLARDAMDPRLVDGYVLYERVSRTGGPGGPGIEIWMADLARRERSLVLSGDATHMWQASLTGDPGRVVCFADTGPWSGPDACTLVRVVKVERSVEP
jgi:hypothetical protein